MNCYLLPLTHPAKNVLDFLFRRPDVIDNDSTFHAAGFETLVKKTRSLMRVAAHPALPEYLFKVYLVEERHLEREKPRGWRSFASRCKGAERICKIIRDQRLQHFRVPRKWQLLLPSYHPACGPGDQPVILVAERQELLSSDENEQAWRKGILEHHLDELYAIIHRAGGASYRPDNIRLTKQGKYAFIDTEHAGDERDYESIIQYLAPPMRKYWLTLNARNALRPISSCSHSRKMELSPISL
jgi:hypothetical protein